MCTYDKIFKDADSMISMICEKVNDTKSDKQEQTQSSSNNDKCKEAENVMRGLKRDLILHRKTNSVNDIMTSVEKAIKLSTIIEIDQVIARRISPPMMSSITNSLLVLFEKVLYKKVTSGEITEVSQYIIWVDKEIGVVEDGLSKHNGEKIVLGLIKDMLVETRKRIKAMYNYKKAKDLIKQGV